MRLVRLCHGGPWKCSSALKHLAGRAEIWNMQIHTQPVAPDGAATGAERVSHVRPEVVDRFRMQVATGAYEPSVENLVDGLMSLIFAGPAGRRPGQEG